MERFLSHLPLLLLLFPAALPARQSHFRPVTLPDQDGDGGQDILVSEEDWSGWCGTSPVSTGLVVLSGSTGEELAKVGRDSRTFAIRNDITEHRFLVRRSPLGFEMRSSLAGQTLWHLEGDDVRGFPLQVALVGNLDDDPHEDVAALLARPRNGKVIGNDLTVLSGRDGRVLYSVPDPDPEAFGWDVAPSGDFDGDRVPDIVVLANRREGGGSRLHVFSGHTGETLTPIDLDRRHATLMPLPDLDGDGQPELGLGSIIRRLGQDDFSPWSIYSPAKKAYFDVPEEWTIAWLAIDASGGPDQPSDLVLGLSGPERRIALWKSGEIQLLPISLEGQPEWKNTEVAAGDFDGDGTGDLFLLTGQKKKRTTTRLFSYAR